MKLANIEDIAIVLQNLDYQEPKLKKMLSDKKNEIL